MPNLKNYVLMILLMIFISVFMTTARATGLALPEQPQATQIEDSIKTFLTNSSFEAVATPPSQSFAAEIDSKRPISALDQFSHKDKMCMASAIYYEARGESELGKLAVGHVVKNRVKSSKFPNSICSVVAQKFKGTCQFSWFCNIGMKPIKKPDAYVALAEKILAGQTKDPTSGAMFFHTAVMGNVWGKKQRARIGAHVFY